MFFEITCGLHFNNIIPRRICRLARTCQTFLSYKTTGRNVSGKKNLEKIPFKKKKEIQEKKKLIKRLTQIDTGKKHSARTHYKLLPTIYCYNL